MAASSYHRTDCYVFHKNRSSSTVLTSWLPPRSRNGESPHRYFLIYYDYFLIIHIFTVDRWNILFFYICICYVFFEFSPVDSFITSQVFPFLLSSRCSILCFATATHDLICPKIYYSLGSPQAGLVHDDALLRISQRLSTASCAIYLLLLLLEICSAYL